MLQCALVLLLCGGCLVVVRMRCAILRCSSAVQIRWWHLPLITCLCLCVCVVRFCPPQNRSGFGPQREFGFPPPFVSRAFHRGHSLLSQGRPVLGSRGVWQGGLGLTLGEGCTLCKALRNCGPGLDHRRLYQLCED